MIIAIGAVSLILGFWIGVYRQPSEESLEWTVVLFMTIGGSAMVMSGYLLMF